METVAWGTAGSQRPNRDTASCKAEWMRKQYAQRCRVSSDGRSQTRGRWFAWDAVALSVHRLRQSQVRLRLPLRGLG
jgi:hypothetical protein